MKTKEDKLYEALQRASKEYQEFTHDEFGHKKTGYTFPQLFKVRRLEDKVRQIQLDIKELLESKNKNTKS